MTGTPSLFEGVDNELRRLDALPSPDADREGARHRLAGDTERASARRIVPRSGTWRRRVLDDIGGSGEGGRTDWEIHGALGGLLYTIAPRRNELLNDGWVCDSGRRRATESGSPAVVWVLSDRGRAEWVPA